MNHWNQLEQIARAEISATLAALPPPLRLRAAELPVIFEPDPHPDLIAEGIEPDSLGLFTGTPFAEADQALSPIPAQITLYLANLWDFADQDTAIFRDEVRTTYLHELGHYLGLDEDDLTERGLD